MPLKLNAIKTGLTREFNSPSFSSTIHRTTCCGSRARGGGGRQCAVTGWITQISKPRRRTPSGVFYFYPPAKMCRPA